MGSNCFSNFYLPHIFRHAEVVWQSILQLPCYDRLNVAQGRRHPLAGQRKYTLMRTDLVPGPEVAPGCVLPQAGVGAKAHSRRSCGGRVGLARPSATGASSTFFS